MTSSADSYNRTLESYYRKSQHEDYGGRLWQYCLIALGCLPPRLITIANDVIAERTEANRAAAASSTAPASTRGQLPQDLGELCRDTDAIRLQEISPAWTTKFWKLSRQSGLITHPPQTRRS